MNLKLNSLIYKLWQICDRFRLYDGIKQLPYIKSENRLSAVRIKVRN